MCRLVFAPDLKSQRLDPGFFAQVFSEGDHGLAQLLPAERLAQIKLIEQCEAAMKFQAEQNVSVKYPAISGRER